MARAARHKTPDRHEQIIFGRAIRTWQDWPDGPDAAPGNVRRRGQRALDAMVAGNLRLVLRAIRDAGMRGAEHDDLLQAGSIGLVQAAKRFNPSLGYAFSTFAYRWVRGSFRSEWRHGAKPVEFVGSGACCGESIEMPAAGPTPAERIEQMERIERVQRELALLADDEAELAACANLSQLARARQVDRSFLQRKKARLNQVLAGKLEDLKITCA
jgi:RNA polymerase sigma factor (sigma-70 family)